MSVTILPTKTHPAGQVIRGSKEGFEIQRYIISAFGKRIGRLRFGCMTQETPENPLNDSAIKYGF